LPQDHENYFQTRFKADPRREHTWKFLTRYVSKYIPADATVVELGAGYCQFINGVQAKRRIAVDLGTAVRECAAPGVEAVCGDAIAFLESLPPSSVDFVFASNFFEHFEWPQLHQMGTLILRALTPGGRLALVQPNFRLAADRYFDDYTHRTIFTDVSLGDWLASLGFRILRVEARFLPLTLKSRLSFFWFLTPLYLRLPWRPLAGQMFVLAERNSKQAQSP